MRAWEIAELVKLANKQADDRKRAAVKAETQAAARRKARKG